MVKSKWLNKSFPDDEKSFLWELYHENSKIGKYEESLSLEYILKRMELMYESLPYPDYSAIPLSKSYNRLEKNLFDTIINRNTTRNFESIALTLDIVNTILFSGYGITREKKDIGFIRSLRTTPSAGALYPLELYFYSHNIINLEPGLYHYNPVKNHLKALKIKNCTDEIASFLTPNQVHLAYQMSLTIFITAIFERVTFKYGSRGYRYAFLEAGHVGQNINLISESLKLGSINICGYLDRKVDEFLDIDGISQSAIYLIGIGKKKEVKQKIDNTSILANNS